MPGHDDRESERLRRLETYERVSALIDPHFAPSRFEEATELPAFAAAVRKHAELVREAMEYYVREWIVSTGKAPPKLDFDLRQVCLLMRETAERLGVTSVPPSPEPPVSQQRYYQFAARMADAAERESSAPRTDGDSSDFKPAGYFRSIDTDLPGRIRKAAQPGRKTKRVRTQTREGTKFYSEADVRQYWPKYFGR